MGIMPRVLTSTNYDDYTGEYICTRCHRWTGSGEDDCECSDRQEDETNEGGNP